MKKFKIDKNDKIGIIIVVVLLLILIPAILLHNQKGSSKVEETKSISKSTPSSSKKTLTSGQDDAISAYASIILSLDDELYPSSRQEAIDKIMEKGVSEENANWVMDNIDSTDFYENALTNADTVAHYELNGRYTTKDNIIQSLIDSKFTSDEINYAMNRVKIHE